MAALTLAKPATGQQTVLTDLTESSRLVFDFSPSDVFMERVEDNLVFNFDDGSSLVLENFYTAYTSETMPDFEADGPELPGADFFAALDSTLMPAAGPAAGPDAARNAAYHDWSTADLMGGIDRLGGLDLGWNGAPRQDETLWGLPRDAAPNFAPVIAISGVIDVVEAGVFVGGNEAKTGVPAASGRVLAFDADGDLWLTVVTPSGGALCRARHDSWGTSVEQVVTQIDGAPLGVLSAVETGPDGKVYFAVSSEAAAKNGLESALRTELIAHTGTGCVYVYDPSARTVEHVLGGVAGAAGLALSVDGRTLYVSDLGDRCVWAVDADARELTAGGKNCGSFVSGLPGYPGALALDEDGTLYISYRWTRSGWLEKHADSTLLRGSALRAGENIQKKLFKLPADAPCAEAVDAADGSWKQTFSGRELDGCTAVCPAGSKVYFGAAGSASLLSARV